MRPTPERLAVLARVADGLLDLDRPLRVVVDGADGAGKTWFAVDAFHHPRTHRHELGRTGDIFWTRSFEYRALRRVLLDPWHGVLVVDGVFAQRTELHDCWDLVVWLEVDDEERVRRMAEHDRTPVADDPVASADVVVDITERERPHLLGVCIVPPGWFRTPFGLRRVLTTDAETAARIKPPARRGLGERPPSRASVVGEPACPRSSARC